MKVGISSAAGMDSNYDHPVLFKGLPGTNPVNTIPFRVLVVTSH